jgi:hypothetical protein
MTMREEEPEREERITMEVVVDAYGEEERAMGWYYYLLDHIEFPFKAECKRDMLKSPLKSGEQVTILGMAPEEECRYGMWVLIEWDKRQCAVPLEQLRPIDTEESTERAVEDWEYWVRQGYLF